MSKAILRVALLSSVVATGLASASARAATVTIDEARASGPGGEVTVEGAVTVPSGAFASFLFDQGFAIQDSTGGIYVRTGENLHLEFHRNVRVTGTLIEEFGLLILVASEIDVLRAVTLVEAQDFPTGAISEATEGLLVTVEGIINRVTDDTPFGYSAFVDDSTGETQIFIPVAPGFHPLNWGFFRPGSTIRATGYSGQFAAQYEVNPRTPGDVQFIP